MTQELVPPNGLQTIHQLNQRVMNKRDHEKVNDTRKTKRET